MGDIKIEESTIDLVDGRKGKVAVFMYTGSDDPVAKLDWAISVYVEHKQHMQFVDINMDNPWTRVVMSGVNDMKQENFDPSKHRL